MNIPTFTPRNDVVILQRIEVDAPAGGLVRPAQAGTEYELYSKVVAVGPGVNKDREDDLQPGDKVIGYFKGAIPLHTELPIYAIQQEFIVSLVEGGDGVKAREPHASKGRLITPVRNLSNVPKNL